MNITLHQIKVRDLVAGYIDNQENGVRAYGGQLDVRPPYQREFVYKDKQRDAVIETLTQGFPLNVMYWAVRDPVGNDSERCQIVDNVSKRCNDGNEGNDGTLGGVPDYDMPRYEIIDGQQRTISICQYVNGDFAYMFRYFHNLTDDEQRQILDYELQVYFCEGSDSEKLKWFKTINIAGEELTEQELRNAVYAGSWVSDAKRYFSKPNCAAYGLANRYVAGEVNRQAYLQTAIDWISEGNIEVYMGKHQHDGSAVALWNHFSSVINWVKAVFTHYRREMKGVDWGGLYRKYHTADLDPSLLEAEVARLMQDSDVQRKRGIYEYVLDHDERHLDLRSFDENTRREVYERQQGICPICGKHFQIEQMQGDHITPWCKGGRTTADNCQMLCSDCNRRKSGK